MPDIDSEENVGDLLQRSTRRRRSGWRRLPQRAGLSRFIFAAQPSCTALQPRALILGGRPAAACRRLCPLQSRSRGSATPRRADGGHGARHSASADGLRRRSARQLSAPGEIDTAGVPLPLGRATAPRSFIGIDNFADVGAACVAHAGAAGQAFLVADAETSSTADLIEKIAQRLRRRSRNFRAPVGLLEALARALGRERDFHRLFAPFALDTSAVAARRVGVRPCRCWPAFDGQSRRCPHEQARRKGRVMHICLDRGRIGGGLTRCKCPQTLVSIPADGGLSAGLSALPSVARLLQ